MVVKVLQSVQFQVVIPGANSVFGLDLDKDGDIDVLNTGSANSGDDVTWWENDGTFSDGGWTEHTID